MTACNLRLRQGCQEKKLEGEAGARPWKAVSFKVLSAASNRNCPLSNSSKGGIFGSNLGKLMNSRVREMAESQKGEEGQEQDRRTR